jgi:capsular polysaccharide transport system permease protein
MSNETSDESPRIVELELQPVLSKGELVVDNWWRPPAAKRVSLLRRYWLFIVTFCVPVALATLYFGVIASDQYVSEATFAVINPATSDAASLTSVLQAQTTSRASDQTTAVSEYITSRDAVDALVANNHLRDILSRPGADFIARFPNFYSRVNREELYNNFQRFVDVYVDSDSGIADLKIRAFTPQDAQDIAKALLANGEALVNRMNARAYQDALRLAEKFVAEEKAKVLDVENRLTAYRNAQKVVDPNKESAVALTGVATLMSDLMETEAQLAQEVAMAPSSPRIAPLRDKIASLRDEISQQREAIAGGDSSLAAKLSEFDELMVDQKLAGLGLETAVDRLINAQQDAEKQQLYLQTIAQPNLADYPLYPKRVLAIFLVSVLSLCAFWISRTVVRNVWEHQA